MPYKDPVNEKVKRITDSINRRFIAHTDMLGSTNAINSRNPAVEPQGQSLLGRGRVIGGGEGCASWSASSATKHYEKSRDPSEMSGGAILGLQDGTLAGDRSKPMQSQTHYDKPETDNTGKFGALGDAFASRISAAPLGPTASNARSGYAHKDDSPLETQDAAYAAKHFSGSGRQSECCCPRLKSGKAPKRCKCGAMSGDGFFGDMWDGFKDTMGDIVGVAKPLLGMVPHPAAQMASAGLEAFGSGKDEEVKECTCPRLKSGKAPKRCKCGARPPPKRRTRRVTKTGGSGFAAGTHMDVGSGETYGISSHGKTRGAGRPRKSGGAVLGLVKSPIAGPLDDSPPAYGNKKTTVRSLGKRSLDAPTTKADMPSSTLSGFGKPKRSDIVKKIMKERGVKLIEASSIVKREGLY